MSTKFNFKGHLNKNFNPITIKNKFNREVFESFFNEASKIAESINKDSFLEMSYKFSPAYQYMLDIFKNGAFLSNDDFESLLVYHLSILENKKIDVYNNAFSFESLSVLDFTEKFDFIYSLLGLTFNDLYSILPQILSYAKIDGILAFKIPAYWYIKENTLEIEKKIIDYSKQNDKKWIFIEPLEPVIEKNGGELLGIKELNTKAILTRAELAYLSSLDKLHDAVIHNNKAHLEIVSFPESGIEIRESVMVIKKKKKTLTKNNLFNV